MKNVVVLSSLILPAAYAAVATILGLFSVTVPSVFEFAGISVALGLVAFAFGDYGRRPRVFASAPKSSAPQGIVVPFVQADQLREPATRERKAA